MHVIPTGCPLSLSSVLKQYLLTPLLSDAGPAFHLQVILVWALFAIVAAAIPYKLRTSWSYLAGFMIATIGALFIFFSVTADSLQAKRALTVIAEEVTAINEKLKREDISDEVRSALLGTKKSKLDQADDHTIRIDLAGVLTNFAAMTLGGYGAGLLAAFVTTNKSRRREAQEETLAYAWLRRNLPALFCFVMMSSLAGVVGLTIAASRDFIAIPCQAQYVGALLGFVVAFLLALGGYLLNDNPAVTPVRRGALVLIALLSIAIHLRATSLSASYLGAVLLVNILPLLLHHGIRQRLLRGLSRLTKASADAPTE